MHQRACQIVRRFLLRMLSRRCAHIESNVVVIIELRLIIDFHAKIAERINSKWDCSSQNVCVDSSLLRGWYGSQSINRCSEHAFNTIVMNWKWYDSSKLRRNERSILRSSFKVQWVVLRVTCLTRDPASCLNQWIDIDISSKRWWHSSL
jgi:hypothetical protein